MMALVLCERIVEQGEHQIDVAFARAAERVAWVDAGAATVYFGFAAWPGPAGGSMSIRKSDPHEAIAGGIQGNGGASIGAAAADGRGKLLFNCTNVLGLTTILLARLYDLCKKCNAAGGILALCDLQAVMSRHP